MKKKYLYWMTLVTGILFAGSFGNNMYCQSRQITATNQKSLELKMDHTYDYLKSNVIRDSTGMEKTRIEMIHDSTGMKTMNMHMDMKHDSMHMDMKHDSMHMKKVRKDCDTLTMKEYHVKKEHAYMKKEVAVDTTKIK